MRAIAAALVVLAGALVFCAGLASVTAYDVADCAASSPAGPFALLAGAGLGTLGLGFLAVAFRDPRRP